MFHNVNLDLQSSIDITRGQTIFTDELINVVCIYTNSRGRRKTLDSHWSIDGKRLNGARAGFQLRIRSTIMSY